MNIIDSVIDAIDTSGRNFNDIDKKSIINFIKSRGVGNTREQNDIYEKLRKVFQKDIKEEKNIKEEPKKIPRNSIFGEIKRIA